MNKVYALVDCNNFFASCERVFQPWLNSVPVAVLSSNDGCIVARSNEVKALGIPMGAPAFKYRDILTKHRVVQFSSNFSLYGDMSRRVNAVLRDHVAEIEVSSIDEAFLELSAQAINDYVAWARELRAVILKWTGIPVSIGIAPTKTLAKVANVLAKRTPGCSGVIDFASINPVALEAHLMSLPVGDVWGVGYRLDRYFRSFGITTAAELKNLPDSWIKQHCNVTIIRTIEELRGVACFDFHRNLGINKSIASTRSFGRYVTELYELKQSVASFVTSAAQKLRQQQATAKFITVFASSGKHAYDYHYHKGVTVRLETPTSYNPDLVAAAQLAIEKIYQPGVRYKRAGIVLTGIHSQAQLNVLQPKTEAELARQDSQMSVVDSINTKWGAHTIKAAAEGIKQPWHAKEAKRSPRYTSSWSELPIVRV